MVLVHPADIDRQQTRVHEAVERGRGYYSSFRIIQPSAGRTVAFEERAEVIPRRAALSPLLIGVAFDVTIRCGDGKPHRASEQFSRLGRVPVRSLRGRSEAPG